MESLTLATPQSVANYQVVAITFNWSDAYIKVLVNDGFGKILNLSYQNAAATTLMVALNKANLSTLSLHKRILNQLVTDGKLPAGTVTGTPD